MENVIENNKLIAVFVNDCESGVYSEDGDFIHASICGVDAESAFYRWEEMKFHSSWDWLMPVVEKIEWMGYWFDFTKGHCLITSKDWADSFSISNDNGSNKIENVYNTVIQFINLQTP